MYIYDGVGLYGSLSLDGICGVQRVCVIILYAKLATLCSFQSAVRNMRVSGSVYLFFNCRSFSMEMKLITVTQQAGKIVNN